MSSFYKNNLLYHRYKFNVWKNLKVWFCRRFGHQINNDPSYHCCGRCGLAYSEIYHRVGRGWYAESGILSKDESKYLKRVDIVNKILKEKNG